MELELRDADGAAALTVFTPHREAIAEATFVLVSPRHPDVERWAGDPGVRAELDELRSGGWERSARDAAAVPVIDSGASLSAPGGRELPLFVSPIVDARFGPTAALGIPSADEADEAIAARMPRAGEGGGAALGTVETREATRYRAADFSIGRQRYWGTPIPVVNCESCGPVPVPVEDLPVVLPRDIQPTGEGNPLAERPDFVDVECPRCGEPAKRETDTLDCHFDALWLWVPAAVPPEDRAEQMFTHPDLRQWLPSERLVAGNDSGSFVFDQRVVTKALRDVEPRPFAFLEDGEPFAGCLFHEMVVADGRKMSKHLGNVVDPDELLASFGADTVRLAVLYAARPQKSLNWSDSAVQHCHRFLGGLWQYCQARFALSPEPLDDATAYRTEFLRNRLAKWCETAVEKLTEDMEKLEMHAAVRNVMRLFDRIKDFEKRVLERSPELGRENHEALLDALALLMAMLAPFAPHIAEELWLASGRGTPGMDPPWPERTSDAVAAGP
jgi:leucyl-tRNA synthetase